MHIRWTPSALTTSKPFPIASSKSAIWPPPNGMCRHIYDAIQNLRRHPHTGQPGIEEGTRELVIPKSPYIVAYRLLPFEALQILRIWNGAQDWR